MHFSITITLALHLSFYQRTSSSRNSFFENQVLSTDKVDNVLAKFFDEFAKAYLNTTVLRQLVIIGASSDDLRQTQALFENYPYILCTDLEKFVYPKAFNSRSFLFIFLDDLGEKTIEKNLNHLPLYASECESMFIFKGITIKTKEILALIARALRGSVFPELAHLDKDTITIYRPTYTETCSLGIMSSLVWKPGTDLSKTKLSLFPVLSDIKRCPISVGTIPSIPKMVTEKDKNGSITIRGGKEGMLVLLMAEKLNFTIVVKYPSPSGKPQESLKESMINEVASGITSFCIGRLGPINHQHEKVVFSKSYGDECLTWGVPRKMITPNLISAEFPWKVWILIGSVFAISCGMACIPNKMNRSVNGNRQDVGFFATVLDILAINLGNPVFIVPISRGGRLMLIFYLFYSTVITTGYKTSLASILATGESSQAIFDVRGIIEANLKTGGSQYNLNILKRDKKDEFVSKLIDRSEVFHNTSDLMHRLNYDQDFACIARRSALNQERKKLVLAQELISFDVLSGCFLSYTTVIAFPEGSFLRKPVEWIIWRAIESGLLKHWEAIGHMNEKMLKKINSDTLSKKRITQKFGNLFIFHVSCLFLCLLVFFIELLTSKFKLKKTRRIVQRGL